MTKLLLSPFTRLATLGAAALMLTPSAHAGAMQKIDIRAQKKSGGIEQSKSESGRKTTKTKIQTSYYVFTLTPRAPDLPKTATAEWIVLTEDRKKYLDVATQGKKELDITPGKRIELTTDQFSLEKTVTDTDSDNNKNNKNNNQGNREGSTQKTEERVAGYALRIVDADGRVLAIDYSSTTFRKKLNDYGWD